MSSVPPPACKLTSFALEVPPELNSSEPLLKKSEPLFPRFCVPAIATTPPLKFTLPENSVFIPDNVSTLAPAWVREPPPDRTPASVPLYNVLKASEPLFKTAPA